MSQTDLYALDGASHRKGKIMSKPTFCVAASVLSLVLVGCGGSSGPTAPTSPPAPPPPVNIAGAWSGTFETQTYTTTPIVIDLVQVGGTVTGTWASSGGTVRPYGNVNGTVDTTTFAGTITYNYSNGPTCSGSFSGNSTLNTLNWSSPGFTTGSCGLSAPGNPLSVRFVLQRR